MADNYGRACQRQNILPYAHTLRIIREDISILVKKEQILLPRRRKRIFQDSREGLQLQDAAAWQWQVAGVENGRVERRHGVESTDKRQEERERERLGSVRFFISFLFRRH